MDLDKEIGSTAKVTSYALRVTLFVNMRLMVPAGE